MPKKLLSLSIALFFVVAIGASTGFAQDWKPVEGKIMSEFAKNVDPKNPHPEYPRPQLARPQQGSEQWQNLNGLWDYAITGENETKPGEINDGKILVPFPIESALSGVGKKVGATKRLWYKRTFTVPSEWKGKQIRLHFGAVDWDSTVIINGQEIGRHKGGYSPFSYDITSALTDSGAQELIVSVWDPTDDRGGTQPRGKQHNNPHGIWYTAVTGIWQTVWIEPVEKTYIEKVKTIADSKTGEVKFEISVAGAQDGDTIEATARPRFGRGPGMNGPRTGQARGEGRQRPEGQARGEARQRPEGAQQRQRLEGGGPGPRMTPVEAKTTVGKALEMKFENPRLWTPDRPSLYNLRLTVKRGDTVLDTVDSYFAIRDIKLGKDDKGITRIMLNGKFLFQHGPLDQGWWPDGLYTPPTDEALAYDVIRTKDFGYNMLRKHVKVECDRFYYHCDRLGMIVWQDMPSGDRYIGPRDPDIVRTPESDKQFRYELKEMIHSLDNHPSIVIWVPFNEGWGQYDTAGITDYTRSLDSTRLINSVSGWADRKVGDMHDIHVYRGPGMPPVEEKRAVVLGEYGGLGLPVQGHTWIESDKNWGYGGNLKDRDDLLETYSALNAKMHPMIAAGLSAAVYTQTTDVEIEVNGLMTYDRKVTKIDVEKFKASNDALHYAPPKYETILATAAEKAVNWKWTTEKPADGWEKAAFDDASWKNGESGFGTKETPNTTVRTLWDGSDIWVRNSFELSADALAKPEQLVLNVFHDEDCEVYINGELVFAGKDHTTNYTSPKVSLETWKKALKGGKNTIAIHCKQTRGGQYIDAGIQRAVPTTERGEMLW